MQESRHWAQRCGSRSCADVRLGRTVESAHGAFRFGGRIECVTAPHAIEGAAVALVRPSPERIRLLEEAVSLGYLRGIMSQLDDIEREQPECRNWADKQRTMARQFQLEALGRSLAETK